MTMKEIRLDGFTEALAESHNIVITNHTNPDGDAMGSALALAHVLKGMRKKGECHCAQSVSEVFVAFTRQRSSDDLQ